VLLVFGWVKLHTEWSLAVSKTADDLACLRVPKVDYFVKRGAQELLTIVSKLNVAYSLGVSHISSKALPMSKHIPDFDCTIVTATQE